MSGMTSRCMYDLRSASVLLQIYFGWQSARVELHSGNNIHKHQPEPCIQHC